MTHILASSPGSWLDMHQHMMHSSLDLHQHMMKLHFGILTWCSSTHDDIYHPEPWYASTHDALFTWLDDQHMIISSSWTWLTSTHDASFTSSSSLQYHQHMMIFSICINTWCIIFLNLDLMTINTWCHPKSSTTWNSTYSSNSRRNVSSTMWLSLITTSYH